MKVRLATNYINSHPVAAICFPKIPASRDRHFASTDHKGSRICSVLTNTVSYFVAITSGLRRANEKKSSDSDQEACDYDQRACFLGASIEDEIKVECD
jgi:hypothetical protein